MSFSKAVGQNQAAAIPIPSACPTTWGVRNPGGLCILFEGVPSASSRLLVLSAGCSQAPFCVPSDGLGQNLG